MNFQCLFLLIHNTGGLLTFLDSSTSATLGFFATFFAFFFFFFFEEVAVLGSGSGEGVRDDGDEGVAVWGGVSSRSVERDSEMPKIGLSVV